MITLKDSVRIHAASADAFDWFRHLDQHYLDWHPDHVACRFPKDGQPGPGSVIHIEEILHGRLHRFRLRITNLVPDREINYRIAPAVYGAFRFRDENQGMQFEASLEFGWSLPVIGALVDRVVNRLLATKLAAIRQHMHEESINLRGLLERAAHT